MTTPTLSPEAPRSTSRSARRWRGPALGAALGVAAVALAACGSSSTSSPTTTSATASGTSGAAATVHLATTSLPSVGSILVGPNGRTLYYLTSDSATSSTCTGQCATIWPPLTVPAGATISGVSGKTGTLMRPDGTTQVTYQGHPVYYYVQDSAPGEDNGQGVDGTWFVLKTPAATASSGGTTTTAPARSGYGY